MTHTCSRESDHKLAEMASIKSVPLSTNNTSKLPSLRIGILGAANIARKNVAAIKNRHSLCQVTAIASRSHSKVMDFVEKNITANIVKEKEENNGNEYRADPPVRVFSGENAYVELVDSQDLVDAIYIPLPTCLHKEWVIKALKAGKHVLVEKPVALSPVDYQEMQIVANETRKYLMDGSMFVHHPRTALFLNKISQPESFGIITRINSKFTFLGHEGFFSTNIRTRSDGDPMGCIGDLGWYCIRMGILILRSVGNYDVKWVQVPAFKVNDCGVPIDATCLVHFVDGKEERDCLLSFHNSFLHPPLRQWLEVCGSKQAATMIEFVIPKGEPNSFQLDANGSSTTVLCEPTEDLLKLPQQVLMWRNFSKRSHEFSLYEGTVDPKVSLEMEEISSVCYQTQLILDALMESIRGNGEKIRMTK